MHECVLLQIIRRCGVFPEFCGVFCAFMNALWRRCAVFSSFCGVFCAFVYSGRICRLEYLGTEKRILRLEFGTLGWRAAEEGL